MKKAIVYTILVILLIFFWIYIDSLISANFIAEQSFFVKAAVWISVFILSLVAFFYSRKKIRNDNQTVSQNLTNSTKERKSLKIVKIISIAILITFIIAGLGVVFMLVFPFH